MNRGFSLIEAVLMMTIVALTAMSVTLTYDTSSYTAELARRKIASDIRFAQSQAMANKQVHGFQATSTSSYEIYIGAAGTPATDPANGTPMTITLSDNYGNALLGNATYSVQFGTNGMPVTNTDLTFSITSGATTKTIQVIKNTGAVVLQ